MKATLAICTGIFWLVGCDSYQGWWGDSEESDTVRWSGTILDGPYTGENDVLTEGTVTVEGLDGELLDEGSEPWSDYPGWWRVDVPPDTPVYFRLAAEGMHPALWSTTTPGGAAYWYTGSLFAYEQETWGGWFQELADAEGVELGSLDERCWLWGAPLSPDDWVGASLQLTDGDGQEVSLYSYRIDDDGLMSRSLVMNSIDYFFAFDLAPGDITLQVEASDGRLVVMDFPAQAGEVISAWYLALPGESL